MIGGKKGKAMADQIMTVSKLRLKSKINVISNEDMQLLEYAIK
ncbi:type II toxin-antitoxin system PemK/MazF family toxin [Candidatus Rickettsia kedanie]